MSAAFEKPGAEYVTDSYHNHPSCDSSAERHSHLQCLSVKRSSDDSPLLTIAPQTQPNEQFYCSNNESRDNVETNKPQQREEARDEGYGLPNKQAAEVAAAARFISKVDVVILDATSNSVFHIPPRPRLGSSTTVRDSIFDAPLKIPRTRGANSQMLLPTSKRSRVTRPPPLQLFEAVSGTEEILTPLPARTSSKGAPCFDIARPLDSAKLPPRSVTSPGLTLEPKTPLAILTPESANTFHFDFAIPAEPSLSRSASDATTDLQSPQTPDTDLADEELQPMEDQIRRDIEAFALEQGPYLRGSQRRTRKPVTTDNQSDDHDPLSSLPATPLTLMEEGVEQNTSIDQSLTNETTSQDEEAPRSATLRRKKSMFGWLQKRPEVEVDDLIDLYLSEDQKEEVKSVKRKASKSKINVFRNRVITDPLPIKGG